MKIKILAFGQISDITGMSTWMMDVVNTHELKNSLDHQFPLLGDIKYAIAVNRQMIQHNTVLNEDDVVALLPPFSGG